MTLYVGDTIFVRASARDPYTKKFLDPMPNKCTVSFWQPGTNHRENPASFGPYTMTRDPHSNHFGMYVETEGWQAGEYEYEIRMVDVVKNREYGSFVLSR